MSEKSWGYQVIVCEGCGSKWRVDVDKSFVIAKLEECPLCEIKKEVT